MRAQGQYEEHTCSYYVLPPFEPAHLLDSRTVQRYKAGQEALQNCGEFWRPKRCVEGLSMQASVIAHLRTALSRVVRQRHGQNNPVSCDQQHINWSVATQSSRPIPGETERSPPVHMLPCHVLSWSFSILLLLSISFKKSQWEEPRNPITETPLWCLASLDRVILQTRDAKFQITSRRCRQDMAFRHKVQSISVA